MRLTSPTNASNTNPKHTGVVGGVQFEASENGTNTGAGARGRGVGVNGYAFAWNSSATNLEEITGVQGEVFTATGSSVKTRIGVASLEEAGTSQGASTDAAFAASALSTSAANFKYGLLFSDYRGGHPVATNGTLIGTSGSATVASGIDWSSYTFTGNQVTGVGRNVTSAGDVRVTTAGTNAASVATLNGAQTLTNKTISGASNTFSNISTNTILSLGSGGACGNIAQNTTTYAGLGNGCTFAAEPSAQTPMSIGATVRNLRVFATATPAAGQTFAITLRKNTADTAVTCTISNPATTCSDTSNTVAFAAGDLIDLKIVTSATSGAAIINSSVTAVTTSP